MKITIIMPVFNEERHINESIQSVLAQSISDWQLLVINDGSTDKTVQLVESYNDSRITLINKANSDQLDCIKQAIPHITGDLVYLLHGDDRIHSNDVFAKALEVFKLESVGYLSYPYHIMNGEGLVTGCVKPKRILDTRFLTPNLLLNFGRNLKVDHFFCRKAFFLDRIVTNYINRNKPFWMSLDQNLEQGCQVVDFAIFDYRCHEGNYLNSKVGLYNVINGNIRSTLDLLNKVSLPFFTIQRYLFKVYNKIGIIGLPVLYKNSQSSPSQALNVLNQLLAIYQVKFDDYSLLRLVQQYLSNDYTRVLDLSSMVLTEQDCFGPAQIRLLNTCVLNDNFEKMPAAFQTLLKELEQGVGVLHCSAANQSLIEQYLDLLNVRIWVVCV